MFYNIVELREIWHQKVTGHPFRSPLVREVEINGGQNYFFYNFSENREGGREERKEEGEEREKIMIKKDRTCKR